MTIRAKAGNVDPDDRRRTTPLDARAKAGERKRCKGMKSTKDKIRVHIEIERENAEHLRDFLKGVKRDDMGGNEG